LFDVLMLSLYLAPTTINITDIIVITIIIFIIWRYLHKTFQDSYLCVYIPSELIVRVSQTTIYRYPHLLPMKLSIELSYHMEFQFTATLDTALQFRYTKSGAISGFGSTSLSLCFIKMYY
jgi:hypothetical protein